ncbi:hypothetical protein LQ327_29450 [Actinomycetospora endophytica]|uniref:Intracellular septation protein A n=1 Tax=Actinomycetospora endophytica TaxID=2291215 RepID=A0ABS8PGV9_9PSEU|nr:VC0807 family protein [Actinomycetospora endophytica]MCD2197504.1 hypothetical protein [Actinomycetospora endophytica]
MDVAVKEPTTSGGLGATLVPLVVDVALPLTATLAVSHLGFGTVASLTAGAVVPVTRTVGSLAFGRRLNRLAALMLATSVAGIVGGLIVGDPRLIVAKDGLVSATIAAAMLLSTLRGTPIMSAGLLPWITRGDPATIAAWERLSAGSAPFRRLERRYTAVWGWVLLTDCVGRAVAAFLVPEAWLTWIGGAVTVAAIVVAAVVSGALVVERLTELIEADTAGTEAA